MIRTRQSETGPDFNERRHGVPGWRINVSAENRFDFSGRLTKAEREARELGAERFAAIWRRPRYGVEDDYCVMPLSVLAALIAETTKT